MQNLGKFNHESRCKQSHSFIYKRQVSDFISIEKNKQNKCRWYPQQRGGLTIPFYTNALTLRTALPAPLCQPQDGKNLVPHVFCSSWSQNLRNPIETRNHRNFRNRQNPSKPIKTKNSKPAKPRNPSKPGTSETFKKTATFQTWGTQSLEPGTFARPHPSKTGTSSRNDLGAPEPVGTHRNLEPVSGTGSRNPVPSQNRPSSPRAHRNLYCAKTP